MGLSCPPRWFDAPIHLAGAFVTNSTFIVAEAGVNHFLCAALVLGFHPFRRSIRE
jgi:hypothetical protein